MSALSQNAELEPGRPAPNAKRVRPGFLGTVASASPCIRATLLASCPKITLDEGLAWISSIVSTLSAHASGRLSPSCATAKT